MRHLSDGALRRLYDEPYALDEETRAHYNTCAECQARFTSVADDARHAMGLMATPAATVDPASALAMVRSKTSSNPSPMIRLRDGWRLPMVRGLAAATLAGGLIAVMAFTPLAGNLARIFQPTQVTPVTISQGDLTGLDALSSWGDVKGTSRGELQQAETAAEAARLSGLPAIQVDASKLPASLRNAPVSYAAATQSSGTITFNGNAPAKLRGSTLTLVAGPGETAVYGDLGKLVQGARNGAAGAQEGTARTGDATSSGGDQQSVDRARQALSSAGPILAIAEMKAPQVSSTGATVADIKTALLAQPGLSPAVRAAISSIDDPRGNLPIPVPAGYVSSHGVRVQGVSGTAFGDNTGLGSAVVWIKNGRVYAVAGTVTEDDLLAVASGVR